MATGKITVAAPSRKGVVARQQEAANKSLEQTARFVERTDKRATDSVQEAAAAASQFRFENIARVTQQTDAANEKFLRSRIEQFEEVRKFENQQFQRNQSLGLKQRQEDRQTSDAIQSNLRQYKAVVRERNLKNVLDISETALKLTQDVAKRAVEGAVKQEAALSFIEASQIDLTPTQRAQMQATAGTLADAAEQEGISNDALAVSDPVQAADQRRGNPLLAGWRAYGRAKGRLQAAKGNWATALDVWIHSEDPVIPDPENPAELISPRALARRGPAGTMAALQAGNAFLFEKFGIEGINPVLVQEELGESIGGITSSLARNIITEDRKIEKQNEIDDITNRMSTSYRGVDWNNPTQVTEYYNSQVQFLAPLVGGKGEANKIVAQQLLNIAVADGNVDMLAGLEVADRSPTDPGVGRVGDGENAPAFKAAADMIAKEEGIEDQAQTDDVNKLIDRIEVDHLNDLTEAGADPAAIEKANKTRIDRLQSIVETTGNEKANEQLMELKTRPLTYTKNGYDVLLRNHQRTGFIPNDEELGEMEAKGILTGSEARDLQNRRGVDAGSKTVKEMYPSIKGIASKVFVTEIVQKAGFNSVQKLGDFGQNAIETLGEETALHLVDWINRQPPGTVTTPGIRQEASRYAREAIQSRAYQIRTREVPVPGVEGIGKPPQLIFEGPAGDLKSRITVRAPNNRVPASRSEDLRGERPDVVNGFMTRNDVILNDKEIDDSIAALRNGTPLPDRVTAVATASGIPAAEVVRSQENASRGTQTAPAGPDVGNPAASAARPVAPQEASLLNHPNVPQQRVSRSRLRIERLRSIQSERAAEARQAALDREQRLNQGTEGGTGDSVSVLRPFLNLIASGESESSGGYNAVAGSRTGIAGLSQMTFAQARAKAGNNAIGRYQFIPGTMEAAMEKAGLKMSDKFSPENQDKLAAAWILGGQRKALSAYIKGESSNLDAAVDDAGWEWAALEGVKGVGQYDNDGVNKATISSGRVRQTLQQARRSYLDSRSSQQTSNSSTGFRTNATLQKLGGEITYSSEKDANGKVLPGRCTTNVLKTLAANGIPQPYATGNDEGNNPRGAAVQFINSFGWKSLPIPGSRQVKLDSPYGKAVVNQMSLQQYKAAVGRGQIPSGAVVFQTRHSSWNGTNSGSRGYDVAIARSGGSRLFNGTYNGDSIYGAATSHIFVLVPSN